MNREQFLEYIQYPDKLNAESATSLKTLLAEFPYCQTTQLLYTKNLHNIQDIHYNKQLRIAAAYTADRKVLYRLIMQQVIVNKIKEIETPLSETKEISPSATTEQFVQVEKEQTAEISQEIDVSPLEKEILKEAIAASIQLEVSKQQPEEKIKKDIGQQIQKEALTQEEKLSSLKDEKHFFNEWLTRLSSQKESASKKKPSPDELITQFIKEEPKITAPKAEFFSPENIARLSIIDDESFVTETLAKIYAKQGNHAKAINAYKNLSKKFPERSSYFLDKIKELEG